MRRATVPDQRPDQDDKNTAARVPRQIAGARAVNPLLVMQRRSGLIIDRHISAATRLLDLYEVGVLGAKDGRGDVAPGTGSAYGAGTYAPEHVLIALGGLRIALAKLGLLAGSVVSHVVLNAPQSDRCDVAAWASRMQMNEQTARGILIGGLDVLADHFFPRERSIVDEIMG